jgi:hypothetical protein
MKRAPALALVFALGGCAFSQKHPGITIGATAGVIGFGACGLAVEKIGTCGIIGGSAALVLGGITGLVTLLADTNDHSLPPFLEEQEDGVIHDGTPPPPGLLPDAGVGAAVDAGVVAPDASLGQLDAL